MSVAPAEAATGEQTVPENDAQRLIDTSLPHPARRYDYWLGGKDNFAADRESGDAIAAAFPDIVLSARQNRAFMHRAVRYLAAEAGVRQFLDIGTGIPTSPNLHEIAQGIAPAAKVVYVDNDPIVLTHARALLNGTSEGVTSYIEADVRDPGKILGHAREILDFTQPIALSLFAIAHFVVDSEDPHGLVAQLVEALPAGSYLALTHATADWLLPEVLAGMEKADASSVSPVVVRDGAEVGRFFAGLELVTPGVVNAARWRERIEPGRPRPAEHQVPTYGGLARKP